MNSFFLGPARLINSAETSAFANSVPTTQTSHRQRIYFKLRFDIGANVELYWHYSDDQQFNHFYSLTDDAHYRVNFSPVKSIMINHKNFNPLLLRCRTCNLMKQPQIVEGTTEWHIVHCNKDRKLKMRFTRYSKTLINKNRSYLCTCKSISNM